MRSFFKSKFFYVITALTLAAVIVPTTLSHMGVTGVLKNAANVVMTPLRSLADGAVESLAGYTAYLTEFDRLREENERLREENARLLDDAAKSRELEQQYEWISEFIELKMQHTDYRLTEASVCGRESGNYSSVFMLDAGSTAGITKNMTVITADGVLGYIADVGYNWSRAVSLLESSSAIGVYDERSGAQGVLCGDFELSREGLCIMSYLADGADIELGDRILTGGYGSVYPRGLIVGYVESVETDEFSRLLKVYVRPAAFRDGDRNISKVMIITDHETTTE